MTDDVCDQTGQVYIDYLMIDKKWYFSSFWKTLSVSDKKYTNARISMKKYAIQVLYIKVLIQNIPIKYV